MGIALPAVPFVLVLVNIHMARKRIGNYHYELICNAIGIFCEIFCEALFFNSDIVSVRDRLPLTPEYGLSYMVCMLPFGVIAYFYLKYAKNKRPHISEFAALIIFVCALVCAATLMAVGAAAVNGSADGIVFFAFYALVPVNYIITSAILLKDFFAERKEKRESMENIIENEAVLHKTLMTDTENAVPAAESEKMPHIKAVLVTALSVAFLFTLCFKGQDVRAGLSSVLFFNAVGIGSLIALKVMGRLEKKAGMLLMLPIFVLSCCNAYFEYSRYNIFNCIAFYVLLTAMLLYCSGLEPRLRLDAFLDTLFNKMFHAVGISVRTAADRKNISEDKAIGSAWKIMLGVCASIPVILVIGGLLSSGDDAFHNALENLVRIDISSAVWAAVVFVCAFVYTCGYIYRMLTNSRRIVFGGVDTDMTIAVAFLTPVNLLFLFFCYSQLSYFGKGISLTDFTTYARFAHEGFFQLLVVTFINFSIILVFTDILKSRAKGALRVSLCLLCVFTFVLILSSFYRMFLYMDAYGFTPLRIEVISFLAVETVLVFTTLYALIKRKTDIVQSFVIGGAVTLFALNITARPEFSADLNNRFAKPNYDYMALEYYTHSSIPVLIDSYNKTADAGEQSRIMQRIRELYNDVDKTIKNEGCGEHWQSVSIQEQAVQAMAKNFIYDKNGW